MRYQLIPMEHNCRFDFPCGHWVYVTDHNNYSLAPVEQGFCQLLEKYRRRHHLELERMSSLLRGEVAKLPYIYRSFQQGQGYRNPVVYYQGSILTGNGRELIAGRYFPNLSRHTLHTFTEAQPSLGPAARTMEHVVDAVAMNSHWRNQCLDDYIMGIKIRQDGVIHNIEVNRDDGNRFDFDDVNENGRNEDLWWRCVEIIKSRPVINETNWGQVIDDIIDQGLAMI